MLTTFPHTHLTVPSKVSTAKSSSSSHQQNQHHHYYFHPPHRHYHHPQWRYWSGLMELNSHSCLPDTHSLTTRWGSSSLASTSSITSTSPKDFPLPRDMVYFCQPDGTTSTSRFMTIVIILMVMTMMMTMTMTMVKTMTMTMTMTMITGGGRLPERRPASSSLSRTRTPESPGLPRQHYKYFQKYFWTSWLFIRSQSSRNFLSTNSPGLGFASISTADWSGGQPAWMARCWNNFSVLNRIKRKLKQLIVKMSKLHRSQAGSKRDSWTRGTDRSTDSAFCRYQSIQPGTQVFTCTTYAFKHCYFYYYNP